MQNQTDQDSPAGSAADGSPGASITPAFIEPREWDMPTPPALEEHDWEILVGAHGHPVAILCSCGWRGGVKEE